MNQVIYSNKQILSSMQANLVIEDFTTFTPQNYNKLLIMQKQLVESLNRFSDEQPPHSLPLSLQATVSMQYRHKAASFSQLSDWNNKNKCVSRGIVLPSIKEYGSQQYCERQDLSVITQQLNKGRECVSQNQMHDTSSHFKAVNIKFGFKATKGFSSPLYQHYLSHKRQKKYGETIYPNEYISLQEQLSINLKRRYGNYCNQSVSFQDFQPNHHKHASCLTKSHEQPKRKLSVRKTVNRKNNVKQQHLLQQLLMDRPDQLGINGYKQGRCRIAKLDNSSTMRSP